MKVVKLVAENFKGLKAVEITPDQNFQIISGMNEQGKSSVLDSIWTAIAGRDALKATDKPIRDGQEKAFISVDLGEITVKRKWSGDKTTLEVTAENGSKFSSPQTMLDKLIGKLSFDPLSFANQDEKTQKETLRELVGINFEELDKERAKLYDERTFNNVSAKKLDGALSELTPPTEDTPVAEVSASEIIEELKAAQKSSMANDEKRRELQSLRQTRDGLVAWMDDLKMQLAAAELELEDVRTRGTALKEEVDGLVDPDIESIQARLSNVENTNTQVRNAEKYRRIEGEAKAFHDASKALTDKIEAIDQSKAKKLQEAKFPVEGLSFDEDGITFNGIPFKQCSAFQRLRVSMAMAMALNPGLRVIRIMDGNLIDSKNMKLIQEMATEQDYQVWVELVDDSGKMGVVIEDGQVKEVTA